MGLYEERLQRIEAAIALEPVDRIPVISGNAAFNAAASGVTLAAYLKDPELNCTCNIKGTELSGDVDGVQSRLINPYVLPPIWLSEVKVPGVDLPDNELWQIHERELVLQEDYDEILENGFESWYGKFVTETLGDPMQKYKPFAAYAPEAEKRFYEAGIPCIKGGMVLSPFEMLCGGRSMGLFLMDDLMEIPEKIDQVFDVIHKYNMKKYEAQFASEKKPYGVWVGGWRGTPGIISADWFERFSWKYMRELIDLCLNYNVLPILHLDSNWDNGLKYFKDLPKGRCVMALDGKTSMKAAHETLGDTMCIMGDVPAEMLAFSTADKVYDYVTELLKIMGSTGYMICSGCDVPFNAKLENVQMMAKARDDFFKR